MEINIALTLYSIRQHLQNPHDIADALARIKAAGYDGVEISGVGAIDPRELKKIIDFNGLSVCSAQNNLLYLRDIEQWTRCFQFLDTLDCTNLVIGDAPLDHGYSELGYAAFAHEVAKASDLCRSKGVALHYHNHAREFFRFGDRTGVDILLEEWPDARMQLDTHWVLRSGQNPVAWIKKLSGKQTLIHCKEFCIDLEGHPGFTEIGHGTLDWRAILREAKEGGVVWYIVEQDEMAMGAYDSIRISCDNLRKMARSI